MRRILDDIAFGIAYAPPSSWLFVGTITTYLILWGEP